MSATITTGLEAWRAAFTRLNDGLWPGPIPIRSERASQRDFAQQLRGRKAALSALRNACAANDLLVVHGLSGVGKTSLLEAGLIPSLKDDGKIVVHCRDWGAGEGVDVADHVTKAAVAAGDLDPGDLADGFGSVDKRFPNKLVIVLDQFEEAIRTKPEFAYRVMRWVEEHAGRSSATFIVSLRSEYEFQLRELYARPFARRSRIEIEPITSPNVIRVIIGGRGGDDVMPIDEDAIDLLTRAWEASQREEYTTPWTRPGLLHLQATLYVLWMAAAEHAGVRRIARDDVIALLASHVAAEDEALDPDSEAAYAGLLGYGLERSVETRIEMCLAACEPEPSTGWVGVPVALRDQARWFFRDITKLLWSGDKNEFKTPQELWHLAEEVIKPKRPNKKEQTRPAWVDALRAHPDWLSAPRSEFPGVHEARDRRLTGQASGPAAGLSDDALLFEQYRAFFLGLEWLSATEIVQVVSTGDHQSGHRKSWTVSLTHDRYARGLYKWSNSPTSPVAEAVGRFAAHEGEELSWPQVLEFRGTVAEPFYVINVRWVSCVVSDTTFVNTVFVNCDFAGTRFRKCEFVGATFVNCVLDDASFIGCDIVGEATWPSLEGSDRMDPSTVEKQPQYAVTVPRSVAAASLGLAHDIPQSNSAPSLFSETSGVAAIPMTVEAADAALRTWVPNGALPGLPLSPGGLVMCGGRLSSLTFRDCHVNEGTVSFRHIAGTSLEICDQDHGTFDFFAAAIRGLTVTRPVGTLPDADDGQGLRFRFEEAKVINTWFGVDLAGRAEFTSCKVWQLINATAEGFTVGITGSQYYGVVNVDADALAADDDSGTNRDFAPGSLDNSNRGAEKVTIELRDLSEKIDYRET